MVSSRGEGSQGEEVKPVPCWESWCTKGRGQTGLSHPEPWPRPPSGVWHHRSGAGRSQPSPRVGASWPPSPGLCGPQRNVPMLGLPLPLHQPGQASLPVCLGALLRSRLLHTWALHRCQDPEAGGGGLGQLRWLGEGGSRPPGPLFLSTCGRGGPVLGHCTRGPLLQPGPHLRHLCWNWGSTVLVGRDNPRPLPQSRARWRLRQGW